jgi:hypothetical protein
MWQRGLPERHVLEDPMMVLAAGIGDLMMITAASMGHDMDLMRVKVAAWDMDLVRVMTAGVGRRSTPARCQFLRIQTMQASSAS